MRGQASAAVIGAGIGGLASAALLAARGYRVDVLEANAVPGGKMSEIRADGFRFDTGPSLMTMPFVLRRLFETCGKRLEDYLTLSPLHPLCHYRFADGTRFDSYSEPEAALAEIRRIAPADTDAYLQFLRYSEDLYRRTADAFLFNPLDSWRDLAHLRISDLLRIDALRTVSSRVDSRFASPYLRQFFKRFTTYNGSSPYRAPATLNVIPHVELTMGGWYVEGGLYRVAQALHRLGADLGVSYRFETPVRRIDVRAGTAVGVDGTAYDVVVSNADAAETYLRLLPPEAVPAGLRRRTAAAEPSCSGFVLLLGLDRRYEGQAHHTLLFGGDYPAEFRDIFDHRRLPQDPSIYIADTSVTDADHAPAGGANWFILVNAPYTDAHTDWESVAPAYGDHLIATLEQRGYDGLRTRIAYRSHITPGDFLRRYRSHGGSIYGTSSNSRLAAFLRPRNRSPHIRNLYLTGGSTHPGGGIPLCVLSAFHAVSHIPISS